MLTLYHHPLSPVSRRVWWALLEKQVPFEPVVVNLTGDQLQPEFLALNPFHHVPVLVDENLRLVESLAILAYLEAEYPEFTLTPKLPADMGYMQMIQLVTANELMPKLPAVLRALVSADADAANDQIATALTFLNAHLRQPYFLGEQFTLADIVVGTAVSLFWRLGSGFAAYPALEQWYQQLAQRPAWQQTHPSDRDFKLWQRYIRSQVRKAG